MPNIRVNTLAREMQIGVKTITEHLHSQNPDKEYSVNSKLTTEEFKTILKEFGKAISKEEQQALEQKYLTPKKGAEEPLATLDKEAKEAAQQKRAATKETKTSDEVKKQVEQETQKGPVIKGKVELDEKGHVIQPPKATQAKEISTPQQATDASSSSTGETSTPNASKGTTQPEASEKPQDKKDKGTQETPVATEAKKSESKQEDHNPVREAETTKSKTKEKKAPESAKPAKAKEEQKQKSATEMKTEEGKQPKEAKPSEASDATKKQLTKETTNKLEEASATASNASASKPRAEEKPEAKSEEKPEKEDKIFRLGSTEGMGVTVVGKVDLSALEPSGRGKGSKRKRKRIRGEKVDVSQVQNQPQSGGSGSGSKSRNTQRKNAQGNQGNQGNANPDGRSRDNSNKNKPKQEKGRKAKRRQQMEQKPEITQEDIQKQIRETMAAIQGGRKRASNQAAKYRREKRDAHRKEQDLLAQEQMEDRTLQLTEYVTANDLAQMIDVPVNDIIMICFNLGMMVSINQRLEKDTIDLILDEYGYTPEYVEAQMLDLIETEEDAEEDLVSRAPIVTVMGHVDHGKTSLLDSIRNADVIAGEAGGITQHVGAYSVTLENGRKITFLDTPGHEAFTAMRARGAKVTDIVIIVVAADDGVMPQTKEALSHASLADVPIIFAINKIDKPQANPDRIKEELANLNYLVEDWGGKYQSQEISAKKGIGIHELLEKVLLEADIMELRANPNKKAVASVLESTMEQGRGYTTKILVQEGTLHVGDNILAGSNYGKVKALFNERGQNVESVGPSEPVKVLGLNGATQAGEVFNVLDTEAEVREIASRREQLKREQRERTQRLPSLMDLGRRIAEGQIQELNIIVKGDMDGSVEALSDSIVKLSTDEVRVNVIHKAVGQISESDVILASASDAIVIGFQVRPAQGARRLAEEEGVEIRTYSIIYDAIDDVTTAMEGMLSPEIKEKVTANIEVRETFKISKVGTIAGCYVRDGKVSRSDKVRVIRDGIVIHTGSLGSLKRFKDDVKEVSTGFECGLNIEGYNDIQVGDLIEAYEEVKVKREL